MTALPSDSPGLETWISRAQAGDSLAVEALLEQFQPLLRSRVYALWNALSDQLSTLERADVEAEVNFLFLSRLQGFRPDAGVYFPHYIERMLHFDGLAWLRSQRRGAAVPFSQLMLQSDDEASEPAEWLLETQEDPAQGVEQSLALRDALGEMEAPQKHLVWQCCVLGRTEADVALELGVSRSAVRNRLEAALCQLRLHFGTQNPVGNRSGRVSPDNALSPEFWNFTFIMAKDEKRPDLVGVGAGRPILLQGTFDFPATGIKTPQLLSPKLRYVVPAGNVAGIRFVRVGAICDSMVCVSTVVNGLPHRLIPVAANSAAHVPLAIVEAIRAGSEIEIHIASDAPGTVILDVGCLQLPS
jgi:assimilatory nitrate reductase catalytic subunit